MSMYRIQPNPKNAHVGDLLHELTDVIFLRQYRQAIPLIAPDLQAVDSRIRELTRRGYGRCRPTPKLLKYPTQHG